MPYTLRGIIYAMPYILLITCLRLFSLFPCIPQTYLLYLLYKYLTNKLNKMENVAKQYPSIINIIRDAEKLKDLNAKIKAAKKREYLILLDNA